jgi:hypothetical protein
VFVVRVSVRVGVRVGVEFASKLPRLDPRGRRKLTVQASSVWSMLTGGKTLLALSCFCCDRKVCKWCFRYAAASCALYVAGLVVPSPAAEAAGCDDDVSADITSAVTAAVADTPKSQKGGIW